METIISALITGAMALLGVIITNSMTHKKIEHQLSTAQAVTDVKIETLTREVREHNNFARRMPVLEEQIKSLDSRLDRLEEKE